MSAHLYFRTNARCFKEGALLRLAPCKLRTFREMPADSARPVVLLNDSL